MNESRVSVQYKGPRLLAGLVKRCGWRYFDRVTGLELRGPDFNDQAAEQIYRFKYLEQLTLDQTKVSQLWIDRFREDYPACEVVVHGNASGMIQSLVSRLQIAR